jgi:hypothetical protein
VEAEKLRATGQGAAIEAYDLHFQRMSNMLQVVTQLANNGRASKTDVARWRFFAKEAQRLLESSKHAGFPGMMAGMMGMGGGQGGSGVAMMDTGGTMGRIDGRVGGGGRGLLPTEKPAPAPPEPPAQPQPQPQAGAAMDGGGFGGDAGGDAEGESRITIARLSAALSTLDKNPKNQAILRKLDEPLSLRFPTDTPLEAVLKRIKEASKGGDGKAIPVYVDPIGLQEAEKTLQSTVTIDLEDVPLRFSLRLLLKQLGLAYCIHDGVLVISSVEGIRQELNEARAEQMGLNPEKFPGVMGGFGGMGGFRGMGGGMRAMGGMGGMGMM